MSSGASRIKSVATSLRRVVRAGATKLRAARPHAALSGLGARAPWGIHQAIKAPVSQTGVAARAVLTDGEVADLLVATSDGRENGDCDKLHPVVDIIAQRAADRQMGLPPRSDGFKLGLVVEGGGMRGITSAAMLLGIHAQKLDRVFDCVYGSSAGAINATYFLANEPKGIDIYSDHIANSTFINLARLFRKCQAPVLNVGFLLDHIMEHVLPLNHDAVVDSELPLKIAATTLSGGAAPTLLEGFRDKKDLVECLRASASPPGISHGPVMHRGQALVDALIFEPVPIWSAIRDGCTHVLALRTQTEEESVPDNSSLAGDLVKKITRRLMQTDYIQEVEAFDRADSHDWSPAVTNRMAALASHCPKTSQAFFGADVLNVYPQEQHVGSLTKNVKSLHKAKEEGARAIYDALAPVHRHLSYQ